jgi:hypothetical protein
MTTPSGKATTSTIVSSRFPRFLELPDELKMAILCQHLIVRRPITARTHIMAYGPSLVRLACVSKHIHNLAKEVYYGGNTFLFSCSHINGSTPLIFHFPKAPVGHHIRTVVLHIVVNANFDTVQEMLFESHLQNYAITGQEDRTDDPLRSEFLVLVRPHPAPSYDAQSGRPRKSKPRTSRADWQLHCPKLRDIKIVVKLDGCLQDSGREILQDLPRSADIPLRAERKTVEVHALGCIAGSNQKHGYLLCDGQCAQIFQRVLEDMLHDSTDSRDICGASPAK